MIQLEQQDKLLQNSASEHTIKCSVEFCRYCSKVSNAASKEIKSRSACLADLAKTLQFSTIKTLLHPTAAFKKRILVFPETCGYSKKYQEYCQIKLFILENNTADPNGLLKNIILGLYINGNI